MSRTSRILLAGATVALAAGLVPLAGAVANVPAGNNGTVKIDGRPWDDIAPNNEPHVGCRFQLDWYGFDADAVSNVEFALQAPTLGNPPLNYIKQLDGDDNSGGGSEAGWDGSEVYNIAELVKNVKAHPVQGYHVKLTINTQPTAQGADVKHKVFWVTDCVGSNGGGGGYGG
ncbi:MAG: hypothetical protein ABI720_00085 [Actinomycetes bacterium]